MKAMELLNTTTTTDHVPAFFSREMTGVSAELRALMHVYSKTPSDVSLKGMHQPCNISLRRDIADHTRFRKLLKTCFDLGS